MRSPYYYYSNYFCFVSTNGNADFTAVTAGELDIRIYGWMG